MRKDKNKIKFNEYEKDKLKLWDNRILWPRIKILNMIIVIIVIVSSITFSYFLFVNPMVRRTKDNDFKNLIIIIK